MTTAPDTLAIGDQIVSFLSTLTYPNTSTLVYKLAQLEAIVDITDQVANGGVCVEVYVDGDSSQRRGFGGRIWDVQTWYLLSMCSRESLTLARQIYKARDALVVPFQQHATLGGSVSNLFHSQLKDTMKFFRVLRNGQWLRAHLAELETKAEWQVAGGVVS